MDGQAMQTIQLARGARHLVPVAPGTLVLVRRGAIRLRPPSEWPADAFRHDARRLDAEESFVATTAGYAELAAIDGAEVLLIPAKPFWTRASAWAGAAFVGKALAGLKESVLAGPRSGVPGRQSPIRRFPPSRQGVRRRIP